jgi:hypothetical protein
VQPWAHWWGKDGTHRVGWPRTCSYAGGGVGVQWSEFSHDIDFSKNLIRARCEGRSGTSVLSP